MEIIRHRPVKKQKTNEQTKNVTIHPAQIGHEIY